MSFLLSPMRRSASSIPSAARAFSTTRSRQLARMTIVGRLGTDPEVVELQNSANPLIKYVVGSDSGPIDNRTTSWFRVAAFPPEGPIRDSVMGLTKGTLVYLEGDATMRSYEDREGNKRIDLNLVQTKMNVLKRPVPRDELNVQEGDPDVRSSSGL